MRVVKFEISSQNSRFCCVDSAGAGAKIEHRVIKIQLHLEILDHLTVEAISKKNFRTLGLRKRRCRQRGKQFAEGYAQRCRLRAGALPREASGWIVCFR